MVGQDSKTGSLRPPPLVLSKFRKICLLISNTYFKFLLHIHYLFVLWMGNISYPPVSQLAKTSCMVMFGTTAIDYQAQVQALSSSGWRREADFHIWKQFQEKRTRMCHAQVPALCSECDRDVLQTWTNKNRNKKKVISDRCMREREEQDSSSSVPGSSETSYMSKAHGARGLGEPLPTMQGAGFALGHGRVPIERVLSEFCLCIFQRLTMTFPVCYSDSLELWFLKNQNQKTYFLICYGPAPRPVSDAL